MAFTKPYTYVDGTNLSAPNQSSNEEALKEYVNQEIEKTDIANNSLDKTDFAQPRYIPVVDKHDFVTKTVQGSNGRRNVLDYNYFSATPKMMNMIDNSVVYWQTITNGSTEVVVDRSNTECIVTVYAQVAAFNNEPGVPFSPGNGQWPNRIALAITSPDDKIAGNASTINYVFEGTGTLPGGAPDPGDSNYSASRRAMTMQFRTVLNVGKKRISLVVDPRVEEGNVVIKSIVAETFYI